MSSTSRTSIILVATTVVVALTGYFRELLVAGLFGAGVDTDAFYFSLALVQTVHDLLFAGILTATIIPFLHRFDISRPETNDQRARFVLTAALVVLVAAVATAVILRLEMAHIIQILAPGMSVKARILALSFSDILVWAIPANAVVTLFILVLNAHNRFRLAASSYLISNIAFIAVAFALVPRFGAHVLPIAFLAGPLFNIPLLAFELHRLKLLRLGPLDMSKSFFEAVWKHARPLVLSLGTGSTIGFLMISQLMARSFAADHGNGAISALGYAFRLYEVPISLAANPAATMLFPAVAALHIAGKEQKVAEVTNSVLMWGLIVLFPAAVITAVGAEPIVRLVLQRGKFDLHAAQLTAEALRGFAPAIMAESVFMVFFRVFYAMHKPGWSVSIAIGALVTLVGILFVTRHGPFILVPLSVSLSFALAAASIIVLLVRRFGWGAIPDKSHIARWAIGAGAGMLAWKGAMVLLPTGMMSNIVALIVFSTVYVCALALLLIEYRRMLLQALRRAIFTAENI